MPKSQTHTRRIRSCLLYTSTVFLVAIYINIQRSHTFTLSNDEGTIKTEQIQPLWGTVKVSGDCDTEDVYKRQTMYSAEDRDIRGAEQDYKKLEKELDKKIKRTQMCIRDRLFLIHHLTLWQRTYEPG